MGTVIIIYSIMFLRLITLLIFLQQNEIVCWARSPGDHALNIEQFPILNFNDDDALAIGFLLFKIIYVQKLHFDSHYILIFMKF